MIWQPTLVAPQIALRPLRPDDHDALFAVAADPLIWAGHPAHDRWQQPVFGTFFDDALASGGALIATDPSSGAVIGSTRYDCRRAEPGEVEIGWTFLARSCWGGAINAQMKRLMIDHALNHVQRTIFVVGETNRRSQRAMEKIGGVLTERTLTLPMAGQMAVHLVYAIDRGAFERGPLLSAAW